MEIPSRIAITVMVAVFAFQCCAGNSEQEMGHGTVVFTIYSSESVVMAADGLRVFFDRFGKETHREYNLVKIAKCGASFLCGSSGLNPIHVASHDGRVKIDYDFDKMLASKQVSAAMTPKSVTDAIYAQYEHLFVGKEAALNDSGYRASPRDTTDIARVAVAGFIGGIVQYCEVWIVFDRSKRKLIPENHGCVSTPGRSRSLLSGHEILMHNALTPDTPASSEYLPLYSRALAVAGTVLPDAPMSIRDPIARAIAIVELHPKFYPKDFGGQTTLGIIVVGQAPQVIQLHP